MVNFIKTGQSSVQLVKQAETEAEIRKEAQSKMWRFRLPAIKGATNKWEEARITFVDGELSAEGFLLPPRWYEHFVVFNGTWTNFVCPEKTNPGSDEVCPLCESGDNCYLAAAFTVIDHRSFKTKNGEVLTNVPRLFICKPQTFEILNKLAVKRGGLAGCSFDVSRSGDKSSSVGNVFDFVEKKSVEELKQIYVKDATDPKTNAKSKVTYFVPANYEVEIVYRTSKELRALGIGKSIQTAVAGNSVTDYSNQL